MAAAAAGARRVLVGVGGSATTDGGRGALEAIEELGGLGAVEVVVACDVDTRFVQAAEQFGPQKGATPAQVVELARPPGRAGRRLPGALRRGRGRPPRVGGGRGPGRGLAALGARLVPGFGVVAEAVGLADRLAPASTWW